MSGGRRGSQSDDFLIVDRIRGRVGGLSFALTPVNISAGRVVAQFIITGRK